MSAADTSLSRPGACMADEPAMPTASSGRVRALRAGITAALRLGDLAIAARLGELHDQASTDPACAIRTQWRCVK
ncbi:MAG TPA: hypothetical protein DCS97_13440, partial [Planctomycetes bacterium]|nr:hypothetical protein [Planctomycetota bacterium]